MQKSLFRIILFLIISCAATLSSAQNYWLQGTIVDTLNDNKLSDACITILRSQDSVLEAFSRTNQEGKFNIQVSNEGSYVVLITFPGFADYVETIKFNSKMQVINMGQVSMISKTHLLSEFVLKQEIAAIKIKGDTTEYVADSFKVRDNATVEELLKRLPGIQVSKSGEVTAQGEKVKKIMVDGEEFFTDDPAVVSKSLQAKAVDKVQVFDKKSEQAEFTGIDDGVREKTINLKLKDNMKRGFFGKAVAGGGTDGFFENQLMLNAFKNKRKLALFGIAANTGKIGLGYEERDKFGGGDNMETSEDGFSYRYYTNDEDEGGWNGQYNGRGLPAAWTGGLHYSNKWFQDKLHLNSNYQLSKVNLNTIGATLTQYNLDTLQYYNDEHKNSFSSADRHSANLRVDYKIDSLSTLRLTVKGSYRNGFTQDDYTTQSVDTSGRVFNKNERHTQANTISKRLNSNLAFRKKFLKQGRTLSVIFNENYSNTISESQLNSIVTTMLNPTPQTIDQRKANETENLQADATVSYTEPLNKVIFIEANYTLTINNNEAKRLSFNKNTDGNYNLIDSLFSSHYNFDVLTNKGGANLKFVFKKLNFSFGGAIASTQFNQKDNFTNKTFHRSFTNFFPSASVKYRPRQQQSISFNYNGYTQQPSIDQIQPLRQNTDPLNVSIGNPNLVQEFDHNLSINFNDYKVFSGLYKYLGAGFNFVNNDISQAQNINDNLIRTYQYINVDGNYNGYLYGGLGQSIRKLNMHLGMNTNINLSNNYSFVNGIRNRNENKGISLGGEARYNKDSLCSIEIGFNISYNANYSTINSSNTNYFTYRPNLDISFFLPLKFEIGTTIDWNIRQKVAAFDNNNNVLQWNAYISKKFLKNDALELRASGYDLLNQNKGFSRVAYANTVTQQNYNTIQRYGMLSLIWNFTKTAAGAPEQSATSILIN